MTEDIEFEQVIVNRVEVKVCRLPFRTHIVCGILYRTDIVNVHIVRYDDDPTWVLPSRPFNTGDTTDKTIDFRIPICQLILRLIPFDIAIRRLLGDCSDRSGTVDVIVTEQDFRIGVCLRLVFSTEVQIDIRYFIPFKSKERLERNIMTVFEQRDITFRTGLIR